MTQVMTYKELAERLDIKLASARRLVMRKKWNKNKGNDGETRINVPLDALKRNENEHDDNHSVKSDSTRDELISLKIENATLKTKLEAETSRANAAEEDRDRWHQIANKSWFRRLF